MRQFREHANTARESLEVANTIRDQLGHKCLFMLGAQYLAGGNDYLSFKIRGSRRVSHIKIILDPSDTYTIEFHKISPSEYKIVKSLSGIYCDQLHEIIRSVTGLNTNL